MQATHVQKEEKACAPVGNSSRFDKKAKTKIREAENVEA